VQRSGRITYINSVASPMVYPETSAAGTIVRRATPADLPWIGCLGALLVEERYNFDPRRFLAAR
jgi:hypothetical protein